MLKQIIPSLRAMIVLTVMTGLIYPLVLTLIAQTTLKFQANGSLLYNSQGQIVGSRLIGQNFDAPQYFHPRPSSAGDKGYDAINSSGSNLGPTNKKLIGSVRLNLEKIVKENPGITAKDVPADAVTSSASGLDPHISPEYALLQVPRVAKARGMSKATLKTLLSRYADKRQFGVFGEPRVNVLLVNMALDNVKR